MKKKICIVCDGHWDQLQGGAEYQLDLLGRALCDRGLGVHYLFVDRGTPMLATPIVLHPLQLPRLIRRVFYPYFLLLSGQIFGTLDRIQPDIVINRVGNAITGICARYGHERGIPTIWHVANITDFVPLPRKFDRTALMTWLDRKALRYGIRNCDNIIAQAGYQNVLLSEMYGRSADLIVPNFHPVERERIVKNRTLTVAWIANIKPKKRPEQFIRLANSFVEEASLRFVMAGRLDEGRYQRSINALLAKASNVEYLGELSIEEVNRLLREASIFVNTSAAEGFPNTFIQAWLRRVPVVSLDFDPDDVLVSNGLGLRSGTFERMIKDVQFLIEHEVVREEIGIRAQKYAEATHGLQANVERIVELIEKC